MTDHTITRTSNERVPLTKSHTSPDASTIALRTTGERKRPAAKDGRLVGSLSTLQTAEETSHSEGDEDAAIIVAVGGGENLLDSQSTITSDASIYSSLISSGQSSIKSDSKTAIRAFEKRISLLSDEFNDSANTIQADDDASETTLQTTNVPASLSGSGRWRPNNSNNEGSSSSLSFVPPPQNRVSIKQAAASFNESWQSDPSEDDPPSGLLMDGDLVLDNVTTNAANPKPQTIELPDGRSMRISSSQGEQQIRKLQQSYSDRPSSVRFVTPFHPVSEAGELQEEEEEEEEENDNEENRKQKSEENETHQSAVVTTRPSGMDQSDLTLDSALMHSSKLKTTKPQGIDQSDLTLDSTLMQSTKSLNEEDDLKDHTRRPRDPDLETSYECIGMDDSSPMIPPVGPPTSATRQGPVLLVQFRWKKRTGFFRKRSLQADRVKLPPVVQPYLKRDQWQTFLKAAARLTFRNHKTGTIYMYMGLITTLCGLSYAAYAIVPFPGKIVDNKIALGASAGLLVAGGCLFSYGLANRTGGEVFEDDLDQLCGSASEQLPGVTIRFRSSKLLDSKVLFGIALYCTDEENATVEVTEEETANHPTSLSSSRRLEQEVSF